MVFLDILGVVWSVVLAILILLAMITVHEFGHFIAGKLLGFKIDEFAIGFGPAIFKKEVKSCGQFSVRALPLGGFCAFAGEDEEGENEDSFNKKAPWKRIIVLLAGAAMNFLTAFVLIALMLGIYGQPAYRVDGVKATDAISAEYCLQDGDIIVSANGRDIYLVNDFVYALDGKAKGESVEMRVERDGSIREITVILRADCDVENTSDVSAIFRALGLSTYAGEDGVEYWSVSVFSYKRGFFATLGGTFSYAGRVGSTLFRVLGELLTGKLGLDAVGGPVSTIKITSEIASQSLQGFLEIAAYIGVNLAVFNILPIPALDGSKVVFCLIEWIFKKPVPRKIEAIIHAVGFVLILAFAILVDVLAFL